MGDEQKIEESSEEIDLEFELPKTDEQKIEVPGLIEQEKPKEQKPESSQETLETVREQREVEAKTPVPAPTIQIDSGEREKQIEEILSAGLEETYQNLPPGKQQEFKQGGEKTCQEINSLIAKGKATAKKIIELIKKWLSLIPGVNRFFLEQEAKIKTDRIMRECAGISLGQEEK